MISSCFAHLKPLPSQLASRTLTLRLDHFPGELTLQLKRAPRSVCRNVLGLEPEQEQIRHDRYGDGAFHPVDLFGDLMLAPTDHSLQLFHQQLDPPPPEIDRHDLTLRHQLGQIGHQDFRVLRPIVAPPCAEDHGDISQMAQPYPFGIDPKRAPAMATDGGQADPAVPPAGKVGDQGFERLPIGEFPGTGQGKHLPIAQLLNERHIRSGRIGGVPDHDHLLTPGWQAKVLEHLPKESIVGLITWIVGAADQGEIDREAIDAPAAP
jgi:hypothetical protein